VPPVGGEDTAAAPVRAPGRASQKQLEARPTAAAPGSARARCTPSAKEAQDDREYPYRESVAIASSARGAAHQDDW
jgi:hypothetical protein